MRSCPNCDYGNYNPNYDCGYCGLSPEEAVYFAGFAMNCVLQGGKDIVVTGGEAVKASKEIIVYAGKQAGSVISRSASTIVRFAVANPVATGVVVAASVIGLGYLFYKKFITD